MKKYFYKIKNIINQFVFKRFRYFRTITLNGVFFIAASLFIGFAAFNTGSNSIYIIFSIMLSVFIFSGFFSRPNISKIQVERKIPQHIVAGERFQLVLNVKNQKKFLSSYSLGILENIDNSKSTGKGFINKLPPKSSKKLICSLFIERRGLYKFTGTKIISYYPFGFFQLGVILKNEKEFIVYPELINISEILAESNKYLGEYESRHKGYGTSLYSLRDYQDGDSAKMIHWKISAKKDNLIVKELDKEENKLITIILDNKAQYFDDSYEMKYKFERAVSIAASLSKYYLDNDYQVKLVTNSGFIPYGSGLNHLYRILRTLALIELEKEDGDKLYNKIINNEEGTQIIYVNFNSEIKIINGE